MKKLKGGARFDGERQFKSALPNRILNIVQNNMNLPNVIYDLFMLLYLLKNADSIISADIDLSKFDINSAIGFFPQNKQLWGIYDFEGLCQNVNEKYAELQKRVDEFITLYITEKGLVKEGESDEENLRFLNSLFDELKRDLIDGELLEEEAYKLGDMDYSQLTLENCINVAKEMKLIEIEYEYMVKQKKMLLYRGGEECFGDRDTYSFSLTPFSGFVNDTTGCAISYAANTGMEQEPKKGPYVLSVCIFNPYEQEDLFYIPKLCPLASLMGHGEIWHGRTKIPERMVKLGKIEFEGLVSGSIYFSDKDRFFKPLVTSLTQKQIDKKIERAELDPRFTKIVKIIPSEGAENYASHIPKAEEDKGYINVYVFKNTDTSVRLFEDEVLPLHPFTTDKERKKNSDLEEEFGQFALSAGYNTNAAQGGGKTKRNKTKRRKASKRKVSKRKCRRHKSRRTRRR